MADEHLLTLQGFLNHSFQKLSLLEEAITHKSFLNEFKESSSPDNERLEFLGDAVLDLVISEYLISHFPSSHEGELSKRKSRIVSEPFLASVAHRWELGSFIRLGRGEELTGGREKDSILANTLEAIIAAIYLDGGLEKVRSFILATFDLDQLHSGLHSSSKDYKSELQEFSQKKYEVLPVYQLVGEAGPDHCKEFEVELRIKGTLYGQGRGRSKKEAEQQAAKFALGRIKKTSDGSYHRG